MVTISRGRKTRVNIKSNLRSSIGPSTRKASFAEMCMLLKLAATNASASLHRHMIIAMNIIRGMAEDRLLSRKCVDSICSDLLLGDRREHRAEDQEDRDIDEVVQRGRGDVPQPAS